MNTKQRRSRRIALPDDWWILLDELATEYRRPRQQVLLDLLDYASIDSVRQLYEEGDQ